VAVSQPPQFAADSRGEFSQPAPLRIALPGYANVKTFVVRSPESVNLGQTARQQALFRSHL
jgi:hypothetical protein